MCVGKYTDMSSVAHSNQGSAESVCAPMQPSKRKKRDQSSRSADLTALIVVIAASVMHVQQPPSIQTKGINHLTAPGNMCEAPAAKKKKKKNCSRASMVLYQHLIRLSKDPRWLLLQGGVYTKNLSGTAGLD